MDEYVCWTVRGLPGESEAAFQGRLAAFWTRVLRGHPDDYEKVYAEATEFDDEPHGVERRYLVEPAVVPVLQSEAQAAGITALDVDPTDTYSKYEAGSSEWFQVEH